MKKYLLTTLLSAAFITNLSVFALTGDSPIDTTTTTSDSSSCYDLQNNLYKTNVGTYHNSDALTNGEVTELQQYLQDEGFLIPNPTGYFGAKTLSAVVRYQRSSGLLATGYVGPVTRAKIKAMSCSVDVVPSTAPKIDSVTPTTSVAPGDTMILNGSGFTGRGTIVLIQGSILGTTNDLPTVVVDPNVMFVSSTQLRIKIPSAIVSPGSTVVLTPGTYSLQVQNTNGTSAGYSFTVATAPTDSPVEIIRADFPAVEAVTGVPYSNSVLSNKASGVVWSFSGSLQGGLSTSTSMCGGLSCFVISGTPTSVGAHTFTVTATANGVSASKQFTLYSVSAQPQRPTASFLIDGVTTATVTAGQPNVKTWSSTRGSIFSTSYSYAQDTTAGARTCSHINASGVGESGSWSSRGGNTASGMITDTPTTDKVGCVVTFTYTVTSASGVVTVATATQRTIALMPTCTPEASQTQTVSCPSGQTGSITQTRTSSCSAGASTPTWGTWATQSSTCVTSPVDPVSTNAPVGVIDSVTSGVVGSCGLVNGWSYDADSKSSSLDTHLYLDGPAGSGAGIGTGPSTILRSDVNSAYGLSGNHGYSYQLQNLSVGNHTVYGYAIGVNTAGTQASNDNASLVGSPKSFTCTSSQPTCTPEAPQTQAVSCPTGQTGSITQTRTSSCAAGASTPTWSTWTTQSSSCVTTPVNPVSNNTPVGLIDSVTSGVVGSCGLVKGWSYDDDSKGTSLTTHIYLDGPAGSGAGFNAGATGDLRQDLNDYRTLTGNHGFTYQIPNLAAGSHRVYGYALGINTSGTQVTNENYLMVNSAQVFTCNPSVSPVMSVSNSDVASTFVTNGEVGNRGVAYKRTTGLARSVPPKGCTQVAGGTTCLSAANYRDFTAAEWFNDSTLQTVITNPADYPLGLYDDYIMYPGGQPIKVGTFRLRAATATYRWSCFTTGGNASYPSASCNASVNPDTSFKNANNEDCYCRATYSSTVGAASVLASSMGDLPPTGLVLGASTSCVDLSRNLHRGDESSQTSKLQSFLNTKGFLKDTPSGFYGDKTVQAVKDYQESKKLPVTGMVYDATRSAIQTESCR